MKSLRTQRQAEAIDELRAIIAKQQTEIDELTRTVAALRLIARAVIGRNRGIETR